MQLAHAGRQTLTKATGLPVLGASTKKCSYFKQKVYQLTNVQIENIIEQFGLAAKRAQTIGFDGVQIHAAHGYLIHQFLSPWTNTRKDKWGNRLLFLSEIINSVRYYCGANYPILVKLSAEDDNQPGTRIEDTVQTVQLLNHLNIDAVEISYGTMEYALNIIRGAIPIGMILKINPLFNQKNQVLLKIWEKLFLPRYLKLFKLFTNNYNLNNAIIIKKAIPEMPIISVGGMRNASEIEQILGRGDVDAVALSRPLICDPDFPNKIRKNSKENSKCTNCNLCTVYCDSKFPLRCFNSINAM
jgi:2,4-dienoyl-CoA reductase-like NADH-dependent reductase (Old Yellow Enzyme family)